MLRSIIFVLRYNRFIKIQDVLDEENGFLSEEGDLEFTFGVRSKSYYHKCHDLNDHIRSFQNSSKITVSTTDHENYALEKTSNGEIFPAEAEDFNSNLLHEADQIPGLNFHFSEQIESNLHSNLNVPGIVSPAESDLTAACNIGIIWFFGYVPFELIQSLTEK